MGINKGKKEIVKCVAKVEQVQGDGRVILIDLLQLLKQSSIGHMNVGGHIIDDSGSPKTELFYTFKYILRFLQNGFIPVVIFDGKTPEAKRDKIEKRKTEYKNISRKINNIFTIEYDENIVDNYKNVIITNIEPSFGNLCEKEEILNKEKYNKIYENFITNIKNECRQNSNLDNIEVLLYHMGIPFIRAPEEADSQCGAISKKFGEHIYGTYTNDLDIILFGSQRIITYDDFMRGMMKTVNKDDIKSLLLNKMQIYEENEKIDNNGDLIILPKEIDDNMLIDILCMKGTDYCEPANIEKTNITDLVSYYMENNMDIERVKSKMDENNIKKFMDARNEFDSACVYDINEDDIKLKQPQLERVRSLCETFVEKHSLDECITILRNSFAKYGKDDGTNGIYGGWFRNKQSQSFVIVPQPKYLVKKIDVDIDIENDREHKKICDEQKNIDKESCYLDGVNVEC